MKHGEGSIRSLTNPLSTQTVLDIWLQSPESLSFCILSIFLQDLMTVGCLVILNRDPDQYFSCNLFASSSVFMMLKQ